MKFEDKETLNYQIRCLLGEAVKKITGEKLDISFITLEHPLEKDHGDYATGVALRLFSSLGKKYSNPLDFANAIVNAFREKGVPDFIGKIEVASPGFINIWLQNDYLINQAIEALRKKEKFGQTSVLAGKKILLEHTSPNPQTTIMLGHLRNNFLGMTVSRILESLGAKVTKDCVVNDRGVHICKALWGYLVFASKNSGLTKTHLKNFREITTQQIKKVIAKKKWQELLEEWLRNPKKWLTYKDLQLKPDHANLRWYVLGSRAYELSERVKKEIGEMLKTWEEEAEKYSSPRKAKKGTLLILWQKILSWSADGYAQTYKRVGSIHDWVWYESDHYKLGKEIVKLGLKKGVFRLSEGAVVTNLSKYNLPDTVVEKSDGTALYITQDLALTKLKCQKFPSDLYIWCIGEEQSLYFKQLFTICEQLGIAKKEKLFHLGYALINFKGGGKMATRKGDVVMADEILEELKNKALEIIKASNQELRGKLSKNQLDNLAEKVAGGALKYSLLKFARETTIYFDIDESLSLEGNSGPYLQYTYARTQSVLRKAQSAKLKAQSSNFKSLKLNSEEIALLREIYKFPEVILEAGQNFAPNLICNYLYDLAGKFNFFYNKWPILEPEVNEVSEKLKEKQKENIRHFRLLLTSAVGQIIKNGLELLGIECPKRM
ncbi:MAG: arginine--tRNA ligase [Microgenomates group bacterium]